MWRFGGQPRLKHGMFRDVTLVPPTSLRPVMRGGLANPEKYPDYCRHWNAGKAIDVQVPVNMQSYEKLQSTGEAPFVYGGIITTHFGHFSVEYVHRLWILQRSDYQGCPVIFLLEEGRGYVPDFFHQFMSYFGIENVIILDKPTLVDRLVIAEQGTTLSRPQHPAYLSELKKIQTRGVASKATPVKKLAILRGHMGKGRIVGERRLSAFLEQEGYVAYRPEEHSIAEQIAAITSAEKIIITDGSACHLFDCIAEADCDVAFLARRPNSRIDKFSIKGKVRSLHVFRDVSLLATPDRRDGRGKHIAASISYMPMQKLLGFLKETGFVDTVPEAGIEIDYYSDFSEYLDNNMRSYGNSSAINDLSVEILAQNVHELSVEVQKLNTIQRRRKRRLGARLQRFLGIK